MTNSQKISAETKTESRACDRHGDYEAVLVEVMGRWMGGKCPTCIEAEQSELERMEREAKAAHRRERIKQISESAGIPRRFRDKTLAGYQASNQGQKRALKIAQRMAESEPDAGTSLVFCGKPGTGKTHLACGIANSWLAECRPAIFATVLSAVRSIKATYSRESETTEDRAISRLTGIDLLIMDEVGVQLGTEHEKMLLFEVINERYQQMRATILISNLTQTELSNYLGDRVMDRFRECGAVVAFDWDSHRGSK